MVAVSRLRPFFFWDFLHSPFLPVIAETVKITLEIGMRLYYYGYAIISQNEYFHYFQKEIT